MYLVRTPDRFRGCLRESEVTYFPRAHQFRHRSDRLLDANCWVDAVQVIKVDVFHPESLQRFFAGAAYIFRSSVHAAILNSRIRNDTEFRSQNHIVATPNQSLAYLDLRIAINVRGVEKTDPESSA